LLQQLKDGNNSAFEHIYNNYKQQLAVNFLKLHKDDDLAADALQELFTRAWNICTAIATNQSAYSCIIQRQNRHGNYS
jgi:RNA polymerase sigma-70 factor (ECF subfamily)